MKATFGPSMIASPLLSLISCLEQTPALLRLCATRNGYQPLTPLGLWWTPRLRCLFSNLNG